MGDKMDAYMSDVVLLFDYSNQRAIKARLRRFMSGVVTKSLFVLCIIIVISGGYLLYIDKSVGWFICSLTVVPYMLAIWRIRELELLPPLIPRTRDVDIADILEVSLLSHLIKNPQPINIATALNHTNGMRFFAIRFGISAAMLSDIAQQPELASEQIWRGAVEIKNYLNQPELTSEAVIVSFVRQLHNYESVLAHLHIDDTDLIQGVQWQSELKQLQHDAKQPRRTGGIARDWSFGYTPLLSRFGHIINSKYTPLLVETDSHQKITEKAIEIFSNNGSQNVALIGATGTGKTTVVESFANILLDANSNLPSSLKFSQVVMLDAASLLSAAPGRGELESLVMEILGEAYAAKNIILCFDNAHLFFEDGTGSVDIGTVLLPVIEAGNVRMIFTLEEQRFLQISLRNSALANAFNRINVPPSNEEDTMLILKRNLVSFEYKRNVFYTYQSLREAYRLSARYVHNIAMPGQAIKLLESSAGFAENHLVTINSVQQAIEQTMDIKVSVASESNDREMLLNLESLIHKRMIGQTRAVQVVSDALRRARAGVRNENRPIGTFLFLGPTGVGKTELSKALAEVYFGGENRIIRLDLNEYVRSEDVTRLIADGSTDTSSLTARVMKQPYSVVLLDEIEKAHPSVLTTLLQLLDEGVLRDINNREVSFRDAIVIATSNAGADRIREYIQRGYKLEQFEEQFTSDLINSGTFKPEFLNRFDEIIMFGSLNKSELLQVVELIIEGVNKTLTTQRVHVSVTENAKRLLVERGYDPRLGARPMRRIIQKTVENTVAKQLLSGAITSGDTIQINEEQIAQLLN